MIEDNLERNKKTKKELDKRRKSKDFISHEDIKLALEDVKKGRVKSIKQVARELGITLR